MDAEDEAADLEEQLLGLSLRDAPAPQEEEEEEGTARQQSTVLTAGNPVFGRDWCSAKVARADVDDGAAGDDDDNDML